MDGPTSPARMKQTAAEGKRALEGARVQLGGRSSLGPRSLEILEESEAKKSDRRRERTGREVASLRGPGRKGDSLGELEEDESEEGGDEEVESTASDLMGEESEDDRKPAAKKKKQK